MNTIRLTREEWHFDPARPLGPRGGFGEVFLGTGARGEVAVKRLLLSAGAAAHREMSIGETLSAGTFRHVVPILDFGLDANGDSYYLIMPVCERSLQDVLRKEGRLPWNDARSVILDIISGLEEVGNIVHRDLKPGNILFSDGRWQIADFGIAKFVEDSTSLDTLRKSLTPAYAAPEQWLGERPTSGTDIYALGCIIYALLEGTPPFSGSIDDVRDGHLHKQAPSIDGIDARLGGLLNVMLRKAQAARPSLERCKVQIEATAVALPAAGPRASLAAAGQAVAQAAADAEATRVTAETAAREWRAIGDEGGRELLRLLERLREAIRSDAPNARDEARGVTLGPATLRWEVASLIDRRVERRPGYPTQGLWEVAAYSSIGLSCELANKSYHDPRVYNFRVTLAFARTPKDGEFRWREVSFYQQFSAGMAEEPTAILPSSDGFFEAFSPVVGGHAVAHGPFTIDAEDEGDFIDRWLALFAKAAHGNLRPPQQLPLSSQFYC
jgi:serine/threonine-protein kinase